jgi:hypothetical protein
VAAYVLVGGGWLGGWCWQRVARRLREEGHDAYPVTLTGLGERVHLASLPAPPGGPVPPCRVRLAAEWRIPSSPPCTLPRACPRPAGRARHPPRLTPVVACRHRSRTHRLPDLWLPESRIRLRDGPDLRLQVTGLRYQRSALNEIRHRPSTKELTPETFLGIISQNHPARCSILLTRSKALLLQFVTSI